MSRKHNPEALPISGELPYYSLCSRLEPQAQTSTRTSDSVCAGLLGGPTLSGGRYSPSKARVPPGGTPAMLKPQRADDYGADGVTDDEANQDGANVQEIHQGSPSGARISRATVANRCPGSYSLARNPWTVPVSSGWATHGWSARTGWSSCGRSRRTCSRRRSGRSGSVTCRASPQTYISYMLLHRNYKCFLESEHRQVFSPYGQGRW